MTGRAFTIAVSGKGGTGKTTLSALLVRSFIGLAQAPVLAVDADPNANLHEALGVTVQETLGCMREEAFTRQIPPGMSRTAYIRYRFRQVLVESQGFDLIAMGRPEGTGCYCFANDLLQAAMKTLERDYRFVVIDSEAGMEHIARGTIGRPDILLIVSDPGARGIRTAVRIRDIARSLGINDQSMFLVFNRYRGESADISGMPRPVAWIPEDPYIPAADLAGIPVGEIPPDSPAYVSVRDLARHLIGLVNRD
ncbi:MAG: AAA family ATPase [Methanoregulaceae archaeon]|nr:AAA family ATPase [Methanoregulaceae archaeon]